MKYIVTALNGETVVDVLGVLREPGELVAFRPEDVVAQVESGILVPVEEEAVPEAPAEGTIPESEGAVVETVGTETVEAQPASEGVPTPDLDATTEPATGTEPVATATDPVQQ